MSDKKINVLVCEPAQTPIINQFGLSDITNLIGPALDITGLGQGLVMYSKSKFVTGSAAYNANVFGNAVYGPLVIARVEGDNLCSLLESEVSMLMKEIVEHRFLKSLNRLN